MYMVSIEFYNWTQNSQNWILFKIPYEINRKTTSLEILMFLCSRRKSSNNVEISQISFVLIITVNDHMTKTRRMIEIELYRPISLLVHIVQ